MNLAISTRQLTKQFEGYAAVNDVDLDVLSGDIYGLIGPNGAGKTTLIRMLAAAEDPTIGDIYINGQCFIRSEANPEIKRQIGYLPDDFPLYDDLTVWDYLDYFGRLYFLAEPHLSQRLNEVLELVSLENKRYSPIGALSRGMKQRLSLARCVIHRPSILLMDEPVSGLDPVARVEFREVLKGLQREGMTILISSHILSDLEDFCNAIGVMELGCLVESSQLQDLYKRNTEHHIIISALGSLDYLHEQLQHLASVQSCEILANKHQVCATVAGSEADLAELLQSLIKSGIAVTEFTRTQESLESIFFKLGHQQTS